MCSQNSKNHYFSRYLARHLHFIVLFLFRCLSISYCFGDFHWGQEERIMNIELLIGFGFLLGDYISNLFVVFSLITRLRFTNKAGFLFTYYQGLSRVQLRELGILKGSPQIIDNLSFIHFLIYINPRSYCLVSPKGPHINNSF